MKRREREINTSKITTNNKYALCVRVFEGITRDERRAATRNKNGPKEGEG